jgi:hypothetical protein
MGITDKEELESALHQLNSNQKKLAEVFQHNQRVFTGGFELVEMHHFVERRVLNDMFKGIVRFTMPRLDEGQTVEKAFSYENGQLPVRTNLSEIDWDWYYGEFKRCVKDDVAKGVLEFCGIALKLPAVEEPAAAAPVPAQEEKSPVVTLPKAGAKADADFVFGGDYRASQ